MDGFRCCCGGGGDGGSFLCVRALCSLIGEADIRLPAPDFGFGLSGCSDLEL